MKKIFIILWFMTTVVLCLKDEHAAKLKKWHMECMVESQVDPDLIIKLKAGSWKLNDKNLKQWVLCLLNKYNIMSKEGVYRIDNALAMVPDRDKKKIEFVIDECIPVYTTAPAPREIAWRYSRCYQKKMLDPKFKDFKLHYLTIFY